MYDLTAMIVAEQRVEDYHRQLGRHRGLPSINDRPRIAAPHPFRTWVGLRLITLGGVLAGASARAAIPTPRATNPDVQTVA